MCGLAGIVTLAPGGEVSEARLARMGDVLRHRGPDDEGIWREGPAGFVHRRLSIVDLAGGHQPMTSEDGRTWIAYNGEIYNHLALRPGLEARGHRYHSRCDTETILHLYEEEGDACVERLEGMFAFALWDGARRRLLLARDRLGIKPLYYATTGGELVFGSEIKALVASGAVPPSSNDAALGEFLASGFTAGDATFYEGVRRLPPGHVLTWSAADGLEIHRYWRPEIDRTGEPSPADFDSTARALRVELREAVGRHLMSDVPLGVLLSGGVDSSALAALAAKQVSGRLRTFAVGFDDPDDDELPYARVAARWIGSRHHEVRVTPREFFEALPALVWHEDEPPAFPSSVALYFVSALAREHVKVVLTGEGADELFLGYERYRVTWWNARLGKVYAGAAPPALRDLIRRGLGRLPARVRRYTSRTFAALDADPRAILFDNFAVFPAALRRQLVAREDLLAGDPYALSARLQADAGGDLLDRMCIADLQTYLHELLMKQDQMSMAASIESRVPFLDDRLVARALAMPGRYKLRGWRGKAVLRAAVHDLVPPAILTRRKMGFPVPLGRWLRGNYWPVVEEFVLGGRARARGLFNDGALQRLALAHRAGSADHAARLWLLITQEIWRRVVLEGEDPAAVMRPVWRRMGTTHARAVDQGRWALAGGLRRPAPHLPDSGRTVAAP